MRTLRIFGVVLVAGFSLASCSGQNGGPRSSGKAARASAQVPASDAMPASSDGSAQRARFARLPDRGELLHYATQAPVREGAYTWHRTELSEQHALDAIASGTLRVVSPNGRLLGFKFDRRVRHASGDWTWIGHMPGREGVQAILTFGAGAVYGSIGQPDTRPLRLTMRNGASWLVETDPTQLAGLASHAANPVSPDYQIVSPAALQRLRALRPAAGVKPAGLAPRTASATAAATTTVDLLIGYTQGFVTAQGGTANVVTRLNSMVDTANAGLINSEVAGQIRLVHTMQVNYTDTNTNETVLDQLTGTDGTNPVPINTAFKALRAARETYGADLVSLVRPFKDPEQDSCGIAWLIGGGKQAVTADWESFGYSVVSDGSDKNESDGKNYYCEEHTLAHELGHNMGSAHDRATQMSDDGVLDDPDDYGAFAYSFGYKPAAFYTIMAYGDSGQTSYLTFSNPRTTFCGGVACGVNNSEDNARSLGLVMPAVAGFRASVVSGPMRTALRDIDGDGNSDFMLHSSSFNRFAWWRMNGAAIQQGVSIGAGAGYVPLGSGDFNGDRKADLMWLRTANRLLLIQVSNGNGFANVYQTTLAAGWNVVGAADIDGDGVSDVMLHNPGTRQFQYWLIDGGVVTSTRTINGVGAGYEVAGYGDVNADGKADVLWTSAARDLYLWAGNGTTFTSARIDDYGSGFAVVGMADIDGDGRSDILFHNPGTRVFQYRLMQGFSNVGGRSIGGVGNGYSVVAYGDYNGDGKADVAWSNATTRAVYAWLGNGATFASSYVGAYPSGWQPAPPANR